MAAESAFASLPGAITSLTATDAARSMDSAASPMHFGNPLREQRQLAEGTAVVELGDRAVVAVGGPERLSWLDAITSQAVATLRPGESAELLILDPHGHIEHAASIVDDGDTAWLIVDEGDVDGLVAWLRRMVFRAQVAIDRPEGLAVVGCESSVGPAAGTVTAEAYAPHGVPLVWRDPWTAVVAGGHQYAVVDPHPGTERTWCESVVQNDALVRLAAVAASGELAPAGLLAAEALRVEAWRPRWANEVDERALPHEFDWLRTAVHLTKGCYRGQETVAKVHNLGHPPRRLVFLHLDGSDAGLPVPGAVVRAADAEVGRVTTSALHHELGPIALAIVKRSLPVDAALTIDVDDGRVAAAQEVIVPSDAGATASVPRLPRLSRRAPAS